jgi:hypothetical protein
MTVSRSFTVTVSNPINATIGIGSAIGIIRDKDDESSITVRPTTNSIVQWGDSMTFYVGAQLLSNTLGDGRRVVNKGIPGQRSAEIAGRQGGLPVSCRVTNELIPSSGIVSVTALGPTIARGVTTTLGPLEVQIAGVRGNLRPVGDVNNPTGYEFSRIGTGSTVPAPGVQPVTPITTDTVNNTVFDLNSYSSILWLGRNGVGDSRETDVTIYQKMIDIMTNPNKLVIILPIFNGGFTNESVGLSGYTARMTRNAAIAEAFPSYWYDVRRDFIDGAKAWMQAKYPTEYVRDWGLAFSGSRADTGPDSDWDVDNDVPPRALRRDKIHPNSMGSQFLAELIAAKLKQIESGNTTNTGGGESGLPGSPTIFRTSDAISPGESISIYGEGLTAAGSEIAIDAINVAQPTTSSSRLNIISTDPEGHYITGTLRTNLIPSVFKLWVKNSSGWSNPIYLNAARPQWISIDKISEDLKVKVVGKNLDGLEFGASRDTRVKLVNGTNEYNAIVLSVNPYAVEFTVDSTVPLAAYKVFVSNNGGALWRELEEDQTLTVIQKGSDPLNLGVFWAYDFNWSREFNANDYSTLQVAVDALKTAGGGVLNIPNGTYNLTSLQLPAGIVLKGQSRSGTILRFSGTSVTNFITTKTDGSTAGRVGITNLTVGISTSTANQIHPNNFIVLGGTLNGNNTAEKIFIKNVTLNIPNEARGSGRARFVALYLGQYGLLDSLSATGWRAYSANRVKKYFEVKDCNFSSGNEGLIANTKNMYMVAERNRISFTSSLTNSVIKRGIEATSHTYMANNYIEKCSGTGNWNEQILFEPRDGLTKMYGTVTSATSDAVTINPRTQNGVLYGHNGNNNWSMQSDYPQGWYITITDGKGLGQYRKITSLTQSTSQVTIDKPWNIIPDNTSKFVISVLALNNIAYKNDMRTGSKPLLFYHNGVDAVFADNYSEDTQGYNITSYYVLNGGIASTRYSIGYFNRMVRNVSKGTARVRGCSGIGYHFFLELNEARTEDAFSYTGYGIDIKKNYVRSILPAPETNSRETPPINGIYLGSYVRQGSGSKLTIKGGVIENNIIRDSNRGISLGGTLYPVWTSGGTTTTVSPTTSMSYGIVVKDNKFMNVASSTQIVDNNSPGIVLINNTTINDTTAPVTTASISGVQQNGIYSSPVSVTLTATDTLSGVWKTEYSFDSGLTWITYETPFTINADGDYSIEYRSIDRVENTESTKILNIKIGGTGVEIPPPPIPQPPVVLPTVTLSVSPTSVQESGSASLVFTFTRTGSTANSLVVNYTVGGTATLGTDYTGIPSAGSIKTVTIPVGSLTAAVVVSPIADDIVEPNETVILTIATGNGYIVGTSTPVTGTIINSSTSVSPTDTLPAFSPTSVNPNLFQGEEYIYGPPLRNLSQLANAVKMTEPNRGFITIPVWRPPVNNVPGNARVLENHTSLTFFYTIDRPWNIYRGNPILRARLEAILEFLISSVNLTLGTGNVDGTNNQSIARLGSDKVEGAPNNNELAGSTFGVKYLGETLMMLEQSRLAGGPVIDENLRQRLISTMRVLIKTCLGFLSFKVSATRFSNQYTGSWGGILAYLSAYDDSEIRQLLITRLAKLADKDNPELITWSGSTFPFQLSSPAGYHYENSGPEWGYVFSTHYPNINHVLGLDQSSSIVDPIVAMEEPWFEWKAYNSVREPDGSVFVVNRAIQTRIVRYGGFQYEESKLAEYIPLARAFMRTDTEHQALVSSERQKMINGWNTPPGTLTSYPPHTFAGKGRPERGFWRPSESQRSAAIASLPYLARTGFVHQRRDSKATVTFVRRPSYYAIFNSGTSTSANIPRYGLGLLWNPQMGSVLQTQSGNVSWWGTSRDASTPPLPHEAAPFTPIIKINGQTQVEQTGVRDLPNGTSGLTTFEYGLFNGGQKTVTFNSNKIDVNVTLTGTFLEHLTLITKTRSSAFTGSISGNTLTVTSVASGTLSVDDWVFGSGIAANTRITQRLTGNGTVGTYRLSNSQTVASRTMETNVDNLTVSSGVIRLIRGANTFEITFPTSVSVIQRTVGGNPPPGFTINRLFLRSSNTLSYSMAFT